MAAIKLLVVSDILTDARHDIRTLEGVEVDDTNGAQNGHRLPAKVSRDLLHLADNLELAAQLVRREYWRVKGYPDRTLRP